MLQFGLEFHIFVDLRTQNVYGTGSVKMWKTPQNIRGLYGYLYSAEMRGRR